MDRQISMTGQQSAMPAISRRAFNALTFGILTVAFLITWGEYLLAESGKLPFLSGGNNVGYIVTVILTFVGLGVMSSGKSKQSVGMSASGFLIFTLTFGATLALTLQTYTPATITYAFAVTACISGIFLVLGVLFPEFFSRIGGVLVGSLIALIIAEIICTLFFHMNQTNFDYITIFLFCGFLGYDSYCMTNDQPTLPNAIFYAADIFIDIINILLRVLRIMSRD